MNATLREFKQLGEVVHVRESDQPSALGRPSLIMLFGWMNGKTEHLFKYANEYQKRFPGATFLVVCQTAKYVWVSKESQMNALKPALEFINGIDLDKTSTLIHVFSNGGCIILTNILNALSSSSRTLPTNMVVLDSCPGWATFSEFVNTWSFAFPPSIRSLSPVPIAAFFFFLKTRDLILHGTLDLPPGHIAHVMRKTLLEWAGQMRDENFGSGAKGRERPWLFFYSRGDNIVDWRRVEEFAGLVEEKGVEVRRERYDKTEHVSHWKSKEEGGMKRYWGAIEDTWNRREPRMARVSAKL